MIIQQTISGTKLLIVSQFCHTLVQSSYYKSVFLIFFKCYYITI